MLAIAVEDTGYEVRHLETTIKAILGRWRPHVGLCRILLAVLEDNFVD